MEVARQVVSQYHYVSVKWDNDNPDEKNNPIQDAVENIRLKCTCHFFLRNAVYCEHLLCVCHCKGIIDVNSEIRVLAKVRSAGRPKQQHLGLLVLSKATIHERLSFHKGA